MTKRHMTKREHKKKTKKFDKTFYSEFSLNENLSLNGELVIDVKVDKLEDCYSQFSPRTNNRISSVFFDYLESEFDNSISKDYVIAIKNENLKDDKSEQKLFLNTFSNKLTNTRIKLFKQRNKTLALAIVFMLLLASLSFANWFIPLDNVGFLMLKDTVGIIQWVLGWFSVESFIFKLPQINKEYRRILKLSLSKIEFI